MPRSTAIFVCTACGGETARWAGQCPHCQAWNTLQEFEARRTESKRTSSIRQTRMAAASRAIPLDQVSAEAAPRLKLDWG
jgi:DNA repair protein RadA/Sms